MRIGRHVLLPALLVSIAAPVWAVTITTTPGCVSAVSGITSTIDFTGPSATDPAGHATYSTPVFNQATNPGCGGDFLSLNTGDTTTIDFDAPINYFGLAWGTKDGYNFLELFDGANLVASVNGQSGDVFDTFDTSYVNFFADAGEQFTRVVLSTTGCCFETDNHSYRLATAVIGVPAPLSVSLLGFGMALIVAGRWVRSRRGR